MTTKIFSDWLPRFELDVDRDIELYVDQFPETPKKGAELRFILLEEPLSWVHAEIKNKPDYYDFVLTYNDEILRTNPKAQYFHVIQPWVNPEDGDNKKFGVSTVVGWKTSSTLEGYAKRHELWRRREEITRIPRFFYLSQAHLPSATNELRLTDSKAPMFDCMFHVAIENTRLKNYFSEKLIDCFVTKTIPIYYGAPYIALWFNSNGMFVVNSVDDIIDICNKLSLGDYWDRLDAIKDNYARAMKQTDRVWELRKRIKKIING